MAKLKNKCHEYSYDENGNLASIVPPGREAHLFNYNGVNLETEYTPPQVVAGVNYTRYFYNRDQDLTQVVRPDGQSIDFIYDNGGRLTTLDTPTEQTTYDYNPMTGQLRGVSNAATTLGYQYDGMLPTETSWSGDINGTVAFSYDNNFWVNAITVNNDAIGYAYDNDGLLTQAGDLVLDRDLSSSVLLGTVLGSVTTDQTYNNFAELDSFTAKAAGSVIYQTQFTRDVLGRIVEKTETINGTTHHYVYDYDLAGRLVNVTKDNTSVAQYLYDDNGNRIGGFNLQGMINASYDAQDRLTQYGTTQYDYTANGELLAKCSGTSTVASYDYDVLGNLRAATLADGTNIHYVIDANNRRVGKKVNGALVQGFLYQDQLNPIAELDANGNVVARFVYGSKPNVPDYMIKNGSTYRLLSDHLGSPILVIDVQTNTIAQQMAYDEFGNVIQDSNPGFQPFGFAGGIYDQHTQLTRFGARDYDAQSGRWTSKDPIRFQGGDTNLYGYVLGDSVNFFDPIGLTTLPASGPITSRYGQRQNPTGNGMEAHTGVDFANPVNGAVVASDSGYVYRIRQGANGLANSVTIQHADGSAASYSHVACKLSVGEAVSEGQQIGVTDLSGRSTGGHLHYEFFQPGRRVDPFDHFRNASPYPSSSKRDGP
ncbi:MAG: peptidoglycan DD-metalloendopeptidase family protein [Gammaproteobacteria bacterium]|nr:peptidoglycan DD-metalloendopeptidase family protein [Gammaproteobacteria bacterium]